MVQGPTTTDGQRGLRENYRITLEEAEFDLKDPQDDPWGAINRDVTLSFLTNQVFKLHDNETKESDTLRGAMNTTRQILSELTDLREKA